APEPAEEPQHLKITTSEYWLSGRDFVQLDPLRITAVGRVDPFVCLQFTIGYVQWAYVLTVRVWFFHRHKITVANVWSGALNVGIRIISSNMRLQDECRNLACAIERHIHHTIGIMVWGAIAHGSTFPLHVVRGTMTAVRYVSEVLRPIVVPYVRGIEGGVFQQDNARPQIARTSLIFLEKQHIEVLPWPPQ
ncbi:DDE 3 domain containing protein, partial [Asbolus verrucosus]